MYAFRPVERIGLLGGMSWESTAVYYRIVNERVRTLCGGLHSADCVVRSVDFAPVEELQRRGDWDAAGRLLAAEAAQLQAAGCELLVLCTNTMHKVAGTIEAAISIPLLHIADATASAVAEAGLTSVGLLATAYTMEQDLATQAGVLADASAPRLRDPRLMTNPPAPERWWSR